MGSKKEVVPEGVRVRLIQLAENVAFRTNIGFLNGSDVPVRVEVEFFLADGTSLGLDFIDLPPFAVSQWNGALNRVTSAPVDDAYADLWTQTPGGRFTCYASVVGNDAFNDPTTILPD